jgi:predicted AlkP superfamily pyrophosphatase or phosphodiesterase
MRFLYVFSVFLVLNMPLLQAQKVKRPKLVVGIVIDQMRYDFLYRYADRYSRNGFIRLLKGGNSCENTFINYLPSYTGPGHTCIYTGTVPSLHGIASNDWMDRIAGGWVYCTSDPQVSAVGGSAKAGKMSPKNLWSSTITDELRLATNFKSKVIAISVKDRASILPGGHTANAAYWMDDSLGVFMSSSFYMKSLPTWVNEFNQENRAQRYMKEDWNTLYAMNTYEQSSADSNVYEGKFANETASVFPHKTSTLKLSDIKKTPFGNTMVVEFAKQAILKEQMGQGNECDFITMSFSSTDYVGHMYGPNSIEVEDTYLRLDSELADFLNFLDKQIGKGEYSLFLTADHGVAHNPQFLIDEKIPAGFFFGSNLKKELNEQLKKVLNGPELIKEIGENFIWLNDNRIDSLGIKRQLVIDEIMKSLRLHEEIQFAIDMRNIQQAVVPEPIRTMAINGFVANRSGDILLLLKPGWLDAYSKTGTTHGTWNPYDTHIPLLWYGWGIQQGRVYDQSSMTDISATLANLLHIQMPNACIGKCIPGVLKN